jgi:hypothetical protein
MAYKQDYGRGNRSKTGYGIPAVFLQTTEDPKVVKMEESIAKRKAFGPTADEQKNAEKFASKAPAGKVIPGTEFDVKSGKTAPKAFEKALKSGKELGLEKAPNDMFITDSAGKILKKAEARNPDAVEALKKEYGKMKSSTEGARKANTMAQNYTLSLAGGANSPVNMKVSKKTAYDIKEASNQKLKPGARKNYAENAQAAMKNKIKK